MSHCGTCLLFFESNTNTARQKIRLIKMANCPNTTRVPVIKGKGIILSPALFLFGPNSIYLSKINITKLALQISVILENNFMKNFTIFPLIYSCRGNLRL